MPATGIPGLAEFLEDYPLMAIRPAEGVYLRLKGSFAFVAAHLTEGSIEDSFALQIDVPKAFPNDLPTVYETGGKIPPIEDYHVNRHDGSLCLGSPLSLLTRVSREPTLPGYSRNCLVPYLFAVSRKLKEGGPLAFGELAHGARGMLEDYARMMDLDSPDDAAYALQLLGMKKRRANKLPCPCRCGKRLGVCSFNQKLREYRDLADRAWFRSQVR